MLVWPMEAFGLGGSQGSWYEVGQWKGWVVHRVGLGGSQGSMEGVGVDGMEACLWQSDRVFS